MLQKIVSSTLNHSLIDLAWVEEIDWMESNLGRLEIKIHMVGVDDLDLNTRVGGKWVCVLGASLVSEWWWRGIYRHLQKSNRYNIIAQLDGTKVKLGGTDLFKMWQL